MLSWFWYKSKLIWYKFDLESSFDLFIFMLNEMWYIGTIKNISNSANYYSQIENTNLIL